jgi:hypothetical protein
LALGINDKRSMDEAIELCHDEHLAQCSFFKDATSINSREQFSGSYVKRGNVPTGIDDELQTITQPCLLRNIIDSLLLKSYSKLWPTPPAAALLLSAFGVGRLGGCRCLPNGARNITRPCRASPAVLDRVQRLRIHPSQPGQLMHIDPIIITLATLRLLH